MITSFGNYTEQMYNGNVPSREEKKNNSTYEFWNSKHGECDIKNGSVVGARFNIDKHRTIYIIGDSLWIVKLLQNEIVQYCYNWGGMICYNKSSIKPMSKDEAEKILGTKINDCKVWNIVQNRAKELFEKSLRGD